MPVGVPLGLNACEDSGAGCRYSGNVVSVWPDEREELDIRGRDCLHGRPHRGDLARPFELHGDHGELEFVLAATARISRARAAQQPN
jgi:hypothetical protein